MRAIESLMKRLYDARPQVETPHSYDELAKLTREERPVLRTQLEAEHGLAPFRAEAWRSSMVYPACGHDALASDLPAERDPAPQAGSQGDPSPVAHC